MSDLLNKIRALCGSQLWNKAMKHSNMPTRTTGRPNKRLASLVTTQHPSISTQAPPQQMQHVPVQQPPQNMNHVSQMMANANQLLRTNVRQDLPMPSVASIAQQKQQSAAQQAALGRDREGGLWPAIGPQMTQNSPWPGAMPSLPADAQPQSLQEARAKIPAHLLQQLRHQRAAQLLQQPPNSAAAANAAMRQHAALGPQQHQMSLHPWQQQQLAARAARMQTMLNSQQQFASFGPEQQLRQIQQQLYLARAPGLRPQVSPAMLQAFGAQQQPPMQQQQMPLAQQQPPMQQQQMPLAQQQQPMQPQQMPLAQQLTRQQQLTHAQQQLLQQHLSLAQQQPTMQQPTQQHPSMAQHQPASIKREQQQATQQQQQPAMAQQRQPAMAQQLTMKQEQQLFMQQQHLAQNHPSMQQQHLPIAIAQKQEPLPISQQRPSIPQQQEPLAPQQPSISQLQQHLSSLEEQQPSLTMPHMEGLPALHRESSLTQIELPQVPTDVTDPTIDASILSHEEELANVSDWTSMTNADFLESDTL